MNTGSNYDAWNIKAEDFPKNTAIGEQIKFLIGYGILAPSTYNSQPWKFKIAESKLIIIPDLRYKLPYADPSNKNLFISLGCCLANIEIAAANFGLKSDVEIFDRGEKSKIEVSFHKAGKVDQKLASLFPFITKRYSNKMPYDGRRIEKKLIEGLEDVDIGGCEAILVDDRSKIKSISELQYRAVGSFLSDAQFIKELSKWLRSKDSEEGDGVPVLPSLQESAAKKVSNPAEVDRGLMLTSSAVGLIVSDAEGINFWINAGRKYETMAIKAVSLGLAMTPMLALIQNEECRKKLVKLLRLKVKIPLMFFRLGYSSDNNIYHTPRKTLASVIQK